MKTNISYKMTDKQIMFIKTKYELLISFLNSRKRNLNEKCFDLFCENTVKKSLIGFDYQYNGIKKEGFTVNLFYSKYKSLKTDLDKLDAVDNETTINIQVLVTKKTSLSELLIAVNQIVKQKE